MAPLVLALICSSVAGDKLAKAKAQAASLEFAIALGLAREALEAGDAEPAETATTIHAFTGELAAALGDRDLSRAEFSRALTLNPRLELPGASPRLREALAEASKQVTGKALSVTATSVRVADGTVSSTIAWAAGGAAGGSGGGTGGGLAGPPWWNTAWTSRAQLTITNPAATALAAGFQVGWPFPIESLRRGLAPSAAHRTL